MFSNTTKTPLSQLGEFGLIKEISDIVELRNDSTIIGIGDDAAVIDYLDKQILITTDMLVEGVHFDLSYVPLAHLGYKAVAVNLSDICAMNGTPEQITVSLALSNRFTVEMVKEIYKGINLACKRYNVDLVGGDTVSSKSGLVISITAIGSAYSDEIVRRDTASANDIICLTGNIGGAYLGLLLLERENKIFQENPDLQPKLDGYNYILERQLKPEPRTDIVKKLKSLNILPTSMIDVSDGLASEIMHLCISADLGASIYDEKLPINQETVRMCEELNLDTTTSVINGGEDYELLFTIKQDDYDKIKDIEEVSVIGYMSAKEEGINLITRSGSKHEIVAQGWDAFVNKKTNEL